MIEPYIVAGVVIVLVIAMGVTLLKRMYDNRTHNPSINVEKLLDAIIPKP